MPPILVFDIETVPDVAGVRRIHDVPEALSDVSVIAWYNQRRRAASGSDFTPHHLQKVVAIACALRDGPSLKVWSIGELGDGEPELIRRFFGGSAELLMLNLVERRKLNPKHLRELRERIAKEGPE